MNSFGSIGPHLGAQDRAAWVQIALNPAGMGASSGWHELHENPSRQPVDCHKITGRRCILVQRKHDPAFSCCTGLLRRDQRAQRRSRDEKTPDGALHCKGPN